MADVDLINPKSTAPDPPAGAGALRANALEEQPVMQSSGEVSDVKEAYASSIARIITWTFAVSAVLLLVGMVLIALIRPGQAPELLIKDTGITLAGVGTFLSSVFGPLLAFVLGYYFGERGKKA